MVKITVENLRKVHQAPDGTPLEVIRDLSFELAGGTFTSILGPSGCGKSTLLNLIAGLDDETGGRVLIGGKPIRENRNLNIGFVFQEPRLLNWRTVRKNILLPLEREKLDRAEMEERVRSKIELTGLAGYENYYPLQLSGGMQQRVSIARALVTDPEILLMDEPFSSLDEITARKMRGELLRIWQETGKTVVFVTHDIAESVFLSQLILIVTQKPCSVSSRVEVNVPYPRSYGDDRLFAIEKHALREFLKMDGMS
jgi:NitT/TauT family transport system ATP-binding protein